jgi:hypothetical protein
MRRIHAIANQRPANLLGKGQSKFNHWAFWVKFKDRNT